MKKDKLPNIVLVLVLTLVTSIAWVSFGIYRSLTAKPPEAVPQAISSPITPTLNQDALKLIDSGIYFDNSQIPNISISPSQTNLPRPTPITLPTSSASATPVASPSAVI